MLTIDFPFHGAVLNHRHGRQTDRGLTIRVKGRAPFDEPVSVNGVETARDGLAFTCEVTLTERVSEIVAAYTGTYGAGEHRVRVVWDRHSRPRYRFSIDDNTFFLRDVAQKHYGSLFDCFYLDILRTLNRRYGAKFSLNIYYATEDGFTLPDFPDKYRGEWADNADWLKLSFHAYANMPGRPYQSAAPEKLAADFDLVANEIFRFAGEQSWAIPTVIHWGMCPRESLNVLAARGVRVLSGFFHRGPQGQYDINYFLDNVRSEHVRKHDVIMDFDSGIVFSEADIVCNNVNLPDVVPTLEPLTRDPDRAEIMDLFTHEQYFWPFYSHYRPDHAERLDAAIRFCTENGYEPVWFHEGFLGVEE